MSYVDILNQQIEESSSIQELLSLTIMLLLDQEDIVKVLERTLCSIRMIFLMK